MESHILTYVRKYLELNYSTYCNNITRKEFDALVVGISKSVKNKYDDIKLILSGGADKFISNVVNKYMSERHQDVWKNYINLKNYISRYVIENNNLNCSKATLNYFVEDICCALLPSYNYSNIMENGGLDEDISKCYKRIVKNSFNKGFQYVSSYISSQIIPLTDIDNVVVANQVIDIIKNTDTMNIVDLLLGKYNDKIVELAEENRKYNQDKRLALTPDTIEYIRRIIEIYPGDKVDIVNQNINKVDMQLRDEGLTPTEITSRKYDLKIRKLYNEYRMKGINLYLDNSIKRDNVPDIWEPQKKKVNMELLLQRLIVTATLLGFVGYGGYTIGKGIHDDRAKDSLSKIDNYSYDDIYSIYGDDFKLTVNNILETYDEYSSYGNINFNYIGFYRAFNSASTGKNISLDDRFYIMDNMLSDVKEAISNNPEYDDLKSVLRTNSCYLDFIYDRLEEMGYAEVREDEYVELLQAYIKAMNKRPYSDPADSLTDSQERLLRKVTKKYQELSEQYWIQLGVLLRSVDDTETNTIVRGH